MALIRRAAFTFFLALLSAVVSSCGGGGSGVAPSGSASAPKSGLPPVASAPLLYVPNSETQAITEYPLSADGNFAPLNTISGPDTFLNSPEAVAFDTLGNMYVSNLSACGACSSAHIAIFAPGASGNATPIAVICGPHTALNQPMGIALDAAGNLYVANLGDSTVTVYAPGSKGDTAPIKTIGGAATLLAGPAGVALDTSGQIYVANAAGSVTVYAAGTSGNAAPTRTINTPSGFPSALTFDRAGNLYVAGGTTLNVHPPNIAIYPPGASAPASEIVGGNTGLDFPNGVAVDSSGNVYVANNACGPPCHVFVFAAGMNGNASPVRTIAGDASGLSTPGQLAIH